ncbi:MAG: alpha/beta hydrolase [Rhodocyclaceae bacterium]|nr:MAG: alpha/beta hydrolase [Rhodocyclaceae bacterium]
MIEAILTLLAAATAVWFIGARYLRGKDLGAFDASAQEDNWRQRFSVGDCLNDEHRAVIASLAGINKALKGVPPAERLGRLRALMDNLFASHPFAARFIPVDAAGVPAEWVRAPGADGARRTLYLHGGAYTFGSARSHRVITSRFSEITGGAVLAIDYRLMPEHSRMAGIEDCRRAYRWLLEFGPDGAGQAEVVYVAGDSAGGNLALSLIAWVRDQGLRAPDAVVALSPATDSSLSSPSIRKNLATDVMLGPLFKPLTRLPRSLLLWSGLLQNRMSPSNPHISPVFGDLANLPPLLVQASEVEILLDDSRRYVNKAITAGTRARLQTWNHVVHVWQLFDPALTEARQAFEEIRKFLAEHSEGEPAS